MTLTTTIKISLYWRAFCLLFSLLLPLSCIAAEDTADLTAFLKEDSSLFSQYEKARFENNTQRKSTLLEALSHQCVEALCLIAAMESLEDASAFQFPKRYNAFSERFKKLPDTLSKLSLQNRLAIEARVYGYLGKEMHPDYPRAILALESLKRLNPSLTRIDLYLWELRLLQGKQHLAKKEEAFPSPKHVLERKKKGFSARIGASPTDGAILGTGARLYWDEEENWGTYLEARAGTRGVYSANVSVFKTGSQFGWGLLSKIRHGLEENYGVGVLPKESISLWHSTRYVGHFYANMQVSEPFHIEGGVYLKHFQSDSTERDTDLGPELRLEYDTRDNGFLPRWGEYISLTVRREGVTVFGHAEKWISLTQDLNWNVGCGLGNYNGELKNQRLLSLGEEIPVPGARLLRYQSPFIGSLWTAARERVWRSVFGGVFSSLSAVGGDTVFSYGGFLVMSQGRRYGNEVRFEVSRFGDGLHLALTSSISAF